MGEEEMEVDGVSEEINSPEDDFDDLSGEDGLEDEFEDNEYDEDAEDELFRENPLKAIWLKLKEISQ